MTTANAIMIIASTTVCPAMTYLSEEERPSNWNHIIYMVESLFEKEYITIKTEYLTEDKQVKRYEIESIKVSDILEEKYDEFWEFQMFVRENRMEAYPWYEYNMNNKKGLFKFDSWERRIITIEASNSYEEKRTVNCPYTVKNANSSTSRRHSFGL